MSPYIYVYVNVSVSMCISMCMSVYEFADAYAYDSYANAFSKTVFSYVGPS